MKSVLIYLISIATLSSCLWIDQPQSKSSQKTELGVSESEKSNSDVNNNSNKNLTNQDVAQNTGSREHIGTSSNSTLDEPEKYNSSNHVPNTFTTKEKVEWVRTEYARINEIASDTFVDYSCPIHPEYGTITFSTNNNQIEYIGHSNHDGSHGGENNQYYFKDGVLFFAFKSYATWKYTGVNSEGYNTMTDFGEETRVYIVNNKIVRCLFKEYSTDVEGGLDDIKDQVPNREIGGSLEDLERLIKETEALKLICNSIQETDSTSICDMLPY